MYTPELSAYNYIAYCTS